MRIGFYHESAGHRESGGIAAFVREMSLQLADTYEVVLYTRDREPTPALRNSAVEVVRIPLPSSEWVIRSALSRTTPLDIQDVQKALMFYSAFQNGYLDHIDEHVDVLVTSQWPDDLLLSNALETPTVYEFHGFDDPGMGCELRDRLSATAHTVANSHHTAERVRNKIGVQVDDVVYPGVDVDRYAPSTEPAFDRDEPIALFVGRVTEQKGAFDLLEAFQPLADSAQLHVVGRGDTSGLRNRARRLGIETAVTVHGVVPEEDLPGYFAACDVFCLPSHYEGLGMANIEAMACEKPVVTTDVGGVPEYAGHEETALVVPPGSTEQITAAIERILESPTLQSELGRAGRSVAREFSWSEQAANLGAFCEQLVLDEERAPATV